MVIFQQRTFTSLVNAHVGRTQMFQVRRAKKRARLNLGVTAAETTVQSPKNHN